MFEYMLLPKIPHPCPPRLASHRSLSRARAAGLCHGTQTRVNLFARVQIKHFALVPQLAPVHLEWGVQYLKVPDRKRGHACNLGLQLDGQPVPMRRHFCQCRFWRQHRVQQRWYTDIVLKKQYLLDRQKHTGLAKTARCDHIRQQSCLACTPRACTRSPSPKRPEMPRVHPWSCL